MRHAHDDGLAPMEVDHGHFSSSSSSSSYRRPRQRPSARVARRHRTLPRDRPSRAAPASPAPAPVQPSVHLYLPHIISGYLQLAFNLVIIVYVLVLVHQFVDTVRNDVGSKMAEYSTDVINEIAVCSKHYVDNRCDPETRVPALEAACESWRACMQRDPLLVSQASVGAETLAGIVNAFVEPISYKTMVFFTLFLGGFMVLSNIAFHFARRSTGGGAAPASHHMPMVLHPQHHHLHQ